VPHEHVENAGTQRRHIPLTTEPPTLDPLENGIVGAVRAGLPTTTLTRAVFGVRGNLPNAFLAWLISVAFEVINTVFGVYALISLFPLLGWQNSGATGKLLAVVIQLMLGGGIAILGHATMVFLQRFFALFLCVVLGLLLAVTVGQVDWSRAGILHGALSTSGQIAAFMTATGLVAAAPISFVYNGPDWVRYLPGATSSRAIFWHVFLSCALPCMLFCIMGALWSTLGDMSDPVAGLKPFIPAWLFFLYILAVIGGSLANNIPTYYSSGLSLQAMGLKVHRAGATAIDLCLSTALVAYVLFVEDFSTALNTLVSFMIVWAGPYAGVWIYDGFRRGWAFDHRDIHESADTAGAYWFWHGISRRGWLAFSLGAGSAILTMKSPVFEGPVAHMLGGADISWLVGPPAAALACHFLLSPEARKGGPRVKAAPLPIAHAPPDIPKMYAKVTR
jgi:NCS1 family nucleobase:cation symporter-1